MLTAPTPITPYATPPSSDDPVNFDARADAKVADDVVKVGEYNALAVNVFNNAAEAFDSATAGAASAGAAAASRDSAANSAAMAAALAGAPAWSPLTNYAADAPVWAPADGRIYRRRAAGISATDPSLDPTNWRPAGSTWWGMPVALTAANNGATLAVGVMYRIDSSAGAFTVSLPVGMANEDRIGFVDQAGKLNVNPVTVLSNGNGNFRGGDVSLVLDVAYDTFDLFKTATGVLEQ